VPQKTVLLGVVRVARKVLDGCFRTRFDIEPVCAVLTEFGISRIVHGVEVLTLRGAGGRRCGGGIDGIPSIRTTTDQTEN
jgi:hypothetical protein